MVLDGILISYYSFLYNRRQYVSINGYESEKCEVKCGIFQGSTLGPLLFLIYINDLIFCLHNAAVSHFADNTCITYSSKDLNSLKKVINSDIREVMEWLNSNRLSLNVKMSKLLLFQSKQSKIDLSSFSVSLSGTKMTPENDVKYLGMQIDNNLSWDAHIHNLSTKLGRANGILSKLRHFIPKNTLKSVYYAVFHSHILYGSLVWPLTTTKNINTINGLLKKCIRIINFAPFNSHTNILFNENKLLKLNDVIRNEQLKFAFQFKKGFLPNDLLNLFHCNVNAYNTRNMVRGGLEVPKIKSVSFGGRSI